MENQSRLSFSAREWRKSRFFTALMILMHFTSKAMERLTEA